MEISVIATFPQPYFGKQRAWYNHVKQSLKE